MSNLNIDFLGIPCENPFFLSSSVVGSNYEMVARAFEEGWGGVVFKSVATWVPEETSPRFDVTRKESTNFVGLKNLEMNSDYDLKTNMEFQRKLSGKNRGIFHHGRERGRLGAFSKTFGRSRR